MRLPWAAYRLTSRLPTWALRPGSNQGHRHAASRNSERRPRALVLLPAAGSRRRTTWPTPRPTLQGRPDDRPHARGRLVPGAGRAPRSPQGAFRRPAVRWTSRSTGRGSSWSDAERRAADPRRLASLDATGQLTDAEGNPVLGERGADRPGHRRVEVQSDGTVLVDGAALDRLRLETVADPATLRKEGAGRFLTPEGTKAIATDNVTIRQGHSRGAEQRRGARHDRPGDDPAGVRGERRRAQGDGRGVGTVASEVGRV